MPDPRRWASIHDPDEKLANTEGRATPGVEIKVVKLDGTVAGAGEEGELRVKGPQLCQGYLDSSLDAEAFDDDGFFRTGDLGNLDADGYVTITGRVKDVIIRKGENISAKEVEDLLFTHPKVADAAVIGLPDPASGERACAVVVPKDPADPPTLAELFEFCKADGPDGRRRSPSSSRSSTCCPRNPTGKVLKHELPRAVLGLSASPTSSRRSRPGSRTGAGGATTTNAARSTSSTPAAVLRGTACVRRGAPFSLSIPMHVERAADRRPGRARVG